ncbi:sigma-70 family RNA polymerase sigma factor [Bacillus sp. JJ722]
MRGDGDAFSRLVQTYERNLYGLARAYLKQDADCDDAVQETILKSFRSLHTLKEPAYFKTWMFRILINECIQFLRTKKRAQNSNRIILSVKAANVPYEVIELKDAIKNLDKDLRIVIHLHYYKDLTIKQVADCIGVPEGTVKSRLYRARILLAEELESSQERNVDYDQQLRQELCQNDFAPLPYCEFKRIKSFISLIQRQILPISEHVVA